MDLSMATRRPCRNNEVAGSTGTGKPVSTRTNQLASVVVVVFAERHISSLELDFKPEICEKRLRAARWREFLCDTFYLQIACHM